MTYTPRLYWVAVLLGALIAAYVGSRGEYSKMAATVEAPPVEVLARAEDVSDSYGGDDPIRQCDVIYRAREHAGAKDIGVNAPDECRPYRDYRDLRGPMAALYSLYGSLIGLLLGMLVNKRLRVAGKLESWTD